MRLEMLSRERNQGENHRNPIDHKYSSPDVSSPEKEVGGASDCDPVYKIF